MEKPFAVGHERKVELVAPAGDADRLKVALGYGADAVYLAGKKLG